MDLRLDGKVALVTGASRGIGLAVASAFASSGARVMLVSRREEGLAEAARAVGPGAEIFAANVGDPAAPEACADATVERLGGLDILVNNAATNPYFGPLMELDVAAADKTAQVNQRSIVTWTQAAWKASMAESGGCVLNMASVGGMSVEIGIGYYNATKAAVIHLTRQLAAELSPGVRVNAIAPGLVKTRFAAALWESSEKAIARRLPLRRLGVPEDVAGAAVFLVSDAASWVTGHTLVVDGGAMVSSNRG